MTYRKLIICPWFGPYPPWMHRFTSNFEMLNGQGYDLLLTSNLQMFNDRIQRTLGFTTPIKPGMGKVHDYRPAFGEIFKAEIAGYDFWGHVDFDCVFGDVGKFLPDEMLAGLDVYSDHADYVCGPWTLYRSASKAQDAFLADPSWCMRLKEEKISGWGESSFTQSLNTIRGLRVVYGARHRYLLEDYALLHSQENSLFVDDEEIMMFHFSRKTEYPPNVRF